MLITLDNVGKSWGSDILLQNINARVNEGDRIGIIGENGAGKTTLLNMLTGEEENDAGEIICDENATFGYLRQMDGLDLSNTVWQEARRVFDDVYDAMEKLRKVESRLEKTPDDQKLLSLHSELENIIWAKDGYNSEFLIKKMLNGMAFHRRDWGKPVHSLSGGERTRLNLAKLLLENPDVLLLDEPTNHLDIGTMAWLEDYLVSYKGTVIAVSHDRYFLDRVASKIWEVEDTFLQEYKGNYSAYEKQKREKVKLQQRQYEADMEKAAKLKDYIDRNLVRASTTKMAQSRRKQLEKMEITEKPRAPRAPLRFSFEFTEKPYDEILTVENLCVKAGDKLLISDLNFVMHSKDRLVIAGPNGAGKTTLINILSGRGMPCAGRVKSGKGCRPAIYDQHVSVGPGTVMDCVWNERPLWTPLEVRNYLARFGYRGEDVFKDSSRLSGGERARLRFCLMSLKGANMLFLDEPTNHIDIYMRRSVTRALSEFPGAMAVVTHDRFLMKELECPILSIEDGKGVFYRDFEAFSEKKKRSEPVFTAKKETSSKPDSFSAPQNAKRARRRSAAMRQRLRDCEREMEKLQRDIDGYNRDMDNPQITTDPEKMRRLWRSLSRARSRMSQLEDEWFSINEKIEKQ